MSIDNFDPEILQDFLTESGELLDQLEGDLVSLESTPEDPELLNQAFRALHTIKGSASFLALTGLVDVAHAAETALNAARNGEIRVGSEAMDLLLRAVDVIKSQFDEITAGDAPSPASPDLVSALTALADGATPATGDEAADNPAAEAPEAEAPPATVEADGSTISALTLDEAKEDLLEFLVVDLEESIAKVRTAAEHLHDPSKRSEIAEELTELAEALARSIEFFEFDAMHALAGAYAGAVRLIEDVDDANIPPLLVRLDAVLVLLEKQAESLGNRQVRTWPLDTFLERLGGLSINQVDPAWPVALDVDGVLQADNVYAPTTQTAPAAPEAVEPPVIDNNEAPAATTADAEPESDAPVAAPASDAGVDDAPAGEIERPTAKTKTTIEQTIRVEVGRLEALMNLVGELVLQKNRVAALSRQASSELEHNADLGEAMTTTAGFLDRVTSDIQVAVMRTRMQPLDKIFGKYPRLIRDLAGKTGKKLRLVVEGGDTEVDKSVIEELGDPLVHLLRNSADHGIESPEDRAAANKDQMGTIRLVASHEGSHVLVQIIDDGKGLSRERIAAKALERGLATESELEAMSDRDVLRFIFAPGFSTAAEVSDLSGRGVGMDVVRTNIEKLKGSIDLESTEGQGTVVSIQIPLTVAIMPAMLVAVADETYAIPLQNIVEIVRPTEETLATIREHPVMRLRDTVLPLIDSMEIFGIPDYRRVETPFAVVVQMNEKRVGLMVSGLIGQQEIVIKRLDGSSQREGPVSGATVRDDGGVSLIVDVSGVIRLAENRKPARAA